jgi:hypothetical protein
MREASTFPSSAARLSLPDVANSPHGCRLHTHDQVANKLDLLRGAREEARHGQNNIGIELDNRRVAGQQAGGMVYLR